MARAWDTRNMNVAFPNIYGAAWISFALFFVTCAFATEKNVTVFPPRWASDMFGVKSPSQIEPALKRTFAASFDAYVQSDSGRRKVTIDTCLAWLAWRGKIGGTEPESDFVALRGQGIECDALALVRAAAPASRSALPADLTTIKDAQLYPASLWIAVNDEDAVRLAKPGFTLAAASGKRHWELDRNGLVLEDEIGKIRLVWIARADFDGDGWEDGLYRWQAWMRGGAWTDIRLLALTRRDPRAALVEVALAAP